MLNNNILYLFVNYATFVKQNLYFFLVDTSLNIHNILYSNFKHELYYSYKVSFYCVIYIMEQFTYYNIHRNK